MKLDPGIKSLRDILTPFDCEDVSKSIVGKAGHFTNDLKKFSDLSLCEHGEIVGVDAEVSHPYICLNENGEVKNYNYFIAESDLK